MPEKHQQTRIIEGPASRHFTYENADRQRIILEYARMEAGSAFWISAANMTVHDITVNGCFGQIFLSSDPKEGNAILWIGEEQNLQFFIDAFSDESVLLHMAESVSLVKTENP